MRIDSILDAIGNTPSVRLSKLFPHHAVYGKCEFLNPGGSLKDRIAVSMIKAAEAQGKIKPGDTLIEATAGNTGIGLAMAGAVLGYKIIITMSDRMSSQKQQALEAYGAKVYRTPIGLKFDDPNSHFSLAKSLAKTLPNAYLLDQFSNPANPEVHIKQTAQEIFHDFGETLSHIFIGMGTGGTLMGISQALKSKIPGLKIIGVEPMGSMLGGKYQAPEPYLLEGIGQDFIPSIFQADHADKICQIADQKAFLMARKLALQEGLWVGGSAGAVTQACQELLPEIKTQENSLKNIKNIKNILLILPDTGRNYGSQTNNPAV
jgi:cystathionine beta-synthase/cysteine synthase A